MTTHRRHHPNQINQTAAKHQAAKPPLQALARSPQPADAALLQRAMNNSGRLSPADVVRLQRTMGNRAVTTLLAGGSPRLQSQPPSRLIQRFADTDTNPDAVVNWPGETDHITKSSAGQMGGVFFFHDQAGRILVLKPEYADVERKTMAGQSQFADKFLRMMGFKTPPSRIIEPDNPEFAQITQLISEKLIFSEKDQAKIGDLDTYKGELFARLAGVKYFKLMQPAQGEPLSDTLANATTIDAVGRVVQTLSDPHLLRQLGRLVVADGVLGNNDRLGIESSWKGSSLVANLGNMIISGNEITTIDSDAMAQTVLHHLHESDFNALRFHSLMDSAIDDADYIFNEFLGLVQRSLQDKVEGQQELQDRMAGTTNLTQFFKDSYDAGAARPFFVAGIKAGLEDVVELFTQQPEQLDTLETEAKKEYVSDPENKESVWDTFMTRGRYLKARHQEGKSSETAKTEAVPYQFYRLIWSKQLPVQLPQVDPLLLEGEFHYPGKKTLSKKGSGREGANELKVKYTNYLANPRNYWEKIMIAEFTNDLNQITGKSDSAKKARFFVKTALLLADLNKARSYKLLDVMGEELKAMRMVKRADTEIIPAAKQRLTTLQDSLPPLQKLETDYQGMVGEVATVLTKKQLRKFGLDKLKDDTFPGEMKRLADKIAAIQQNYQPAASYLSGLNPIGWRRGK